MNVPGRVCGVLVACAALALPVSAAAHGGWRGGHRGGVGLGVGIGLGFGLGYVGGAFGRPYGYYGPRVVVPAPVYAVPGYAVPGYGYYGPPAGYGYGYAVPGYPDAQPYDGPQPYPGPSAYVAPPAYVPPPAYSGPRPNGAQPGQTVQPQRNEPAPQPPGTVGLAPYSCQNAALVRQLGTVDAAGTPSAGGTIVGALLGGEAGRWIDLREQACIARALELAPPGFRVTWQSVASAARFAVVAGAVEQDGERLCRSFEAEYSTGRGARKAFGSACRRDDGAWVAAAGQG